MHGSGMRKGIKVRKWQNLIKLLAFICFYDVDAMRNRWGYTVLETWHFLNSNSILIEKGFTYVSVFTVRSLIIFQF